MHPLMADAYTVSSDTFISNEAREKSVYSFVNRYAPIQAVPDLCLDSRMVLYGLSDFIKKHLLEPVTRPDIRNAAEFMRKACSFGGPLPFPEEMWNRVVDEHGGFLPIKISALPEGSTFFPNEPVVQVTAEDGFGELAAFVEAALVGYVSCASARVTLARHYLERCREYLKKIDFKGDIDGRARFMVHDFGMRASSCTEESSLFGRAHLLVFHGTDSFNAAFDAWGMGMKRPSGTSIIASSHRIIQGHKTQENAFRAIIEAAKTHGGIASFVPDCYNTATARELLIKLAKEYHDVIIVFRDDSGDYIENTHKMMDIIKRETENIGYLHGDSMNPVKTRNVLEICSHFKFVPTFGIGGWLRNTANRDLFSSSFKLAATSEDAVMKIAEVETKRSVPGPNKIRRTYDDQSSVFMDYENVEDSKVTHYSFVEKSLGEIQKYCVPYHRTETFDVLQDRTIQDFDRWKDHAIANPYWGCNKKKILSEETLRVSDEIYSKYR